MAFIQQPLSQEEFTMKIVEDLGQTTANENTVKKSRYAIFECTQCNKHFKARATGKVARAQTSCQECTLNEAQTYKHPLYAIWNGIRQRCYSPRRKDYHKYGGIGVTMCAEWREDFNSFFTWCQANGWKPELVVDKDIKCREQNISPTVYSPTTISFITTQANSEEANAKCVGQYTLEGEFIAYHVSTVAAVLSLGKKASAKSSIANCARGVSKSSFGFKWKYKLNK